MRCLLEQIRYKDHGWSICGALNMVALFLGYTKYCYFLYEWESCARDRHYNKKNGHHVHTNLMAEGS